MVERPTPQSTASTMGQSLGGRSHAAVGTDASNPYNPFPATETSTQQQQHQSIQQQNAVIYSYSTSAAAITNTAFALASQESKSQSLQSGNHQHLLSLPPTANYYHQKQEQQQEHQQQQPEVVTHIDGQQQFYSALPPPLPISDDQSSKTLPVPTLNSRSSQQGQEQENTLAKSSTTSNSLRSSSRKRSLNISDRKSDSIETKTRKKGGGNDGRWSKRFSWPEELHREFVAAVFDVGLKHSSPSAILEHMEGNKQITSERVKSHLQKYRLHRAKSKKEFMSSYDSTLSKMNLGTMDLDGMDSIQCGEVAAHLTYSIQQEKPGNSSNMCLLPAPDPSSHSALHLPQLTEEEKRSPIGASMGYLMGLFFSLQQQLNAQRAATTAHTSNMNGTANRHHDSSVTTSANDTVSNAVGALHQNAHQSTAFSNYTVSATVGSTQGGGPFTQPAPNSAFVVPNGSDGTNDASAIHTSFYSPSQPSNNAIPQSNSPPSNSNSSVENPYSLTPNDTNSPSDKLIDDTNLMKRDMRSQKVFQNKMRKLKQQEFNKYSGGSQIITADPLAGTSTTNMKTAGTQPNVASAFPAGANVEYNPVPVGGGLDDFGAVTRVGSGDGNTSNAESGLDDAEFWNTGMNETELFDFLKFN
jgi:SHAQKYF class myb-like DNA-binding protein